MLLVWLRSDRVVILNAWLRANMDPGWLCAAVASCDRAMAALMNMGLDMATDKFPRVLLCVFEIGRAHV